MKILVIILIAAAGTFALNRDGLPGVHKTQSAKTLRHGNLGLGFFGTVSTDGNMVKPGNNSSLASISAFPFLSIGLSNYLDVGATLPVYWDDFTDYAGVNELQIGDFRYKLKAQIPYFADKHVVDGAFFFGGSLPTSHTGHGIIPREIEYVNLERGELGSPQYGYRKAAIVFGGAMTVDFGEINKNFQFKWHNNIGMRRTFKSDVEEVLFYSVALDYRIVSFISGFAEFLHESRFDRLQTENEWKTEPVTLGFGGMVHTPIGIDIQLGLIVGLNRKHQPNVFYKDGGSLQNHEVMVTAPLTSWVGVSWRGWLVAQDRDKDGIPDHLDACPDEPEDFDGFQDEDGCPDPDNDGDGIPDHLDLCPNEPEDFDGFQDDDGCPDLDNDEDGIPDHLDACPNDTEDFDGFEDADGCPDPDNDRDGICDPWVAEQGLSEKYAHICKGSDLCPMVAEDFDGFEDTDGCPDIDNDKDGIPDHLDKCPNQPGLPENDGCPDEKPKVKEVVNVTLHGVNFKTGSAELTFESFQILDGVVEQLLAYPEVEIEIRGHTDNVGSDNANQKLSERRAQSVGDYLMKKGVVSNRIKAVGYGESQPIAPNKSAEGRRQNRRIEMYRVK